MKHIRKHILTDEANQPVAVQIEYQDWLEIEKALATVNGKPASATSLNGGTNKKSPNDFRGTIELTEDPMDYQRRVRSEWP